MQTRLSSPIEAMKDHYDVVVVGSGYGGGIAASRMARAGRTVAVLERGRERLPGEYPDSQREALAELQFSNPGGRVGPRTALFDFRSYDDISVLVGCGLGGTSLINANVSLRAERRVFDDPRWPAALRADLGEGLEAGYRRAEAMLRPRPYPTDRPRPAKTAALEVSAARLGGRFVRPPLNVAFQAGPNAAGVHQNACTGCGDCVSGCNVGAKTTVLVSYLADARSQGAEIFTRVAVQRVARRPDGRWAVHCQFLEVGREDFAAPPLFVTADVVVLAAGALGSTEILLRSSGGAPAGERLSLSRRLGHAFTGNGDVLGFGYNNAVRVNGIGRRDPDPADPVGPTITGLVDLRERERLDEGMVIEEGSIPGALAPLLSGALAAAALTGGRGTSTRPGDLLAAGHREVESLVHGPYRGAVQHTQTYLAMTHDDGAGLLRLDPNSGQIRIEWSAVGRQPAFSAVDRHLVEATRATGGTFVANPTWSRHFRYDLVTVHPLGGCALGDDALLGVVDHKGRVFRGTSGSEVYEGLYVTDGAVIPRPVGVNPLLTISALAERCCALLARDRGWTIDYETLRPLPARPAARRPGIRFTETMAGHVAAGFAGDDYAEAAREGRARSSTLRITVTIVSDDLEGMLSDPMHSARMVGTVEAPALSQAPLTLTDGEFNLFCPDPSLPEVRQMRYRGRLGTVDGRTLFFRGFKAVRDDPGLDAWADLTTLFVTVYEGTDEGGPVAARGIIRIRPHDLATQLTTMRVVGEDDPRKRLAHLAAFGRFFAGNVFEVHGGIAAGQSFFDPAAPARRLRPLRAVEPEVHPFAAGDGTPLRLTRYHGGPEGPVMLSHGLGVSSRIFSTDTIDTNLLEYLLAHGYDVWLLDYRASIDLPASLAQFDGDDVARHDYPAAVDTIRRVTGAESVQVVAHCFGSTTFTMAMLAGLQGVRSAVLSQVSTHVAAPFATRAKAWLHTPALLRTFGVQALDARAERERRLLERMYDATLSVLRPRATEERCRSATCHRISFMYSLLYEHEQLNALTHEVLHELFGLANMRAFDHLARMVRAGRVVDAQGRDRYLPHAERLAIPITFLHGERNTCFLTRGTEETHRFLRARNGDGLYGRRVIPGYGHIDCIFGRDAARDVYPHVLEHLRETA